MGLDPLLVAGQLFSFSTFMPLVGLLTCKTVSRITYFVLVETLNLALSYPGGMTDFFCGTSVALHTAL